MRDGSTKRSRNSTIRASKDPRGLEILVSMPFEDAKYVADNVNRKSAKTDANKAIMDALRSFERPKRRARIGLLQGNIPREARDALAAATAREGMSATDLISDLVSRWIDPHSGKFLTKTRPDGTRVRKGPANLKSFVAEGRRASEQAREAGTLVRLQVNVGKKLALRLDEYLDDFRVGRGEFLTALILKLAPPPGETRLAGEPFALKPT